ncbi:hypothetical protein [Flavobacterium beibuense]|uniref:Uncharacterized protein n=1 Tax=Flavobacterium beibuense TaxID=657326 RepID=A0A444WFK5_9FLAO|nr:hypothetical protein [Flavobacterium beibuense]RYJ44556.1 hypothetical protein NU09_1166 [Flavobacterium beibuense]
MKTIRLTLIVLAVTFILSLISFFHYGAYTYSGFLLYDIETFFILSLNIVVLHFYNKRFGKIPVAWLFKLVAVLMLLSALFCSWNVCQKDGYIRILNLLGIKYSAASMGYSFYLYTFIIMYWVNLVTRVLEVIALFILLGFTGKNLIAARRKASQI